MPEICNVVRIDNGVTTSIWPFVSNGTEPARGKYRRRIADAAEDCFLEQCFKASGYCGAKPEEALEKFKEMFDWDAVADSGVFEIDDNMSSICLCWSEHVTEIN